MPAEAAATEAPVLLGLRPGLVDELLRAVARLSQQHERLLERRLHHFLEHWPDHTRVHRESKSRHSKCSCTRYGKNWWHKNK